MTASWYMYLSTSTSTLVFVVKMFIRLTVYCMSIKVTPEKVTYLLLGG